MVVVYYRVLVVFYLDCSDRLLGRLQSLSLFGNIREYIWKVDLWKIIKKIFFLLKFCEKKILFVFFVLVYRSMVKGCRNIGVDVILCSHRAFQPGVNTNRCGESEERNCLFVYGKVMKTWTYIKFAIDVTICGKVFKIIHTREIGVKSFSVLVEGSVIYHA